MHIKFCPYCGSSINACSTVTKDFTGSGSGVKDPDVYTYVAEEGSGSTEYYAPVDTKVTCTVVGKSWYTDSGDSDD